MLTKKQADKLRGHISHVVDTSKAFGRAQETSGADWKTVVSDHRKASGKLHKYIASCTEPNTGTSGPVKPGK
jgi:hypothetical protein